MVSMPYPLVPSPVHECLSVCVAQRAPSSIPSVSAVSGQQGQGMEGRKGTGRLAAKTGQLITLTGPCAGVCCPSAGVLSSDRSAPCLKPGSPSSTAAGKTLASLISHLAAHGVAKKPPDVPLWWASAPARKVRIKGSLLVNFFCFFFTEGGHHERGSVLAEMQRQQQQQQCRAGCRPQPP